MNWKRHSYPFLFAIFPIIGVTASNAGEDRVLDTILLSLAMCGLVAILYGALYLIIRQTVRTRKMLPERSADLTAFILFLAVAVFYLYPYVAPWAGERISFVRGNPRMGSAQVVVIALAASVIFWIVRRWRSHLPALADVGRFLSLAGALVVTWTSLEIAYTHVADARRIRNSALIRELAQPLPMRTTASAVTGPAAKRDVYVVLLDAYPGSDVLRERFGIDNTPFEDSLRAIGFKVPRVVLSNYAVTLMSVSSLLNFAQTQPLERDAGRDTHDFSVAAYILEHNRAERFLKTQGYRFVFFPSSWYTPTQNNTDADDVVSLGDPWNIDRMLQTSQVLDQFTETTAAKPLRRYFATEMDVHGNDIPRTFAGMRDMAPSKQPVFAFAHVLAPHPPFIVDATCRPLPRGTQLQWDATVAGRAELGAELTCLNRQLLQTIHALIARSSTPPVIILQGDHGSQALKIFASTTALPTVEQSRERFRPFGAYYLPDGGAAAMPDSVSIVNVLRYVFNYYFDTNLAPLPNTMYYSHWKYPYRLTRVDSNFRAVRQ